MALDFLKKQPTNVIICIFLLIWGAMFMVVGAIQPLLIPMLTGDPNMNGKTFFEEGIVAYPNAYMLINVLSTACMFFLPAVLFTITVSDRPLEYLRLNQSIKSKQFILVTLGVLAIFPLISGIGALLQQMHLGDTADALEAKRTLALNNYIKNGTILDLVKNLILVALIPAVFEELFFRGIIQRLAYSITRSPIGSFMLTSFIFTLFHASIYQFLPIFIGGIILCWVYYITGNMKLNIWLHFLNNGIQIVLLYLSGQMVDNAQNQNIITIGIYLFVGIIMSVLLYTQLKKVATPLPYEWHFNPYKQINQSK